MIDKDFGKPERRAMRPITAKIRKRYGSAANFAVWHNISHKMVMRDIARGDTAWLERVMAGTNHPPELTKDDIRKWSHFWWRTVHDMCRIEGFSRDVPARAARGQKNKCWMAIVLRMRKEGVI